MYLETNGTNAEIADATTIGNQFGWDETTLAEILSYTQSKEYIKINYPIDMSALSSGRVPTGLPPEELDKYIRRRVVRLTAKGIDRAEELIAKLPDDDGKKVSVDKVVEASAFLSYSHIDDEHDGGFLSKLRERLSGEVRVQTGQKFDIFQDRINIRWGQNWSSRITGSLDESMFLIPIITPSYFTSEPCMDELKRFMEREASLKRNDLILPIYYIHHDPLHDKSKIESNQYLKAIADHQWSDWRNLRHSNIDDKDIKMRLSNLADDLKKSLNIESKG